MTFLAVEGTCPICDSQVRFTAHGPWLRDTFICENCHSIPRERALMTVLSRLFPTYRELKIHESSPSSRGVSAKLERECIGYSCSHYFPETVPGDIDSVMGYRCENLEELTFDNDTFDIFLTQDVFEHLFSPGKAMREISRVLKPGGAHIFTVPLVCRGSRSRVRAVMTESGVEHLFDPEYHGNPIDDEGSLVTIDWGYDIANYALLEAGTPTTIFYIDDLSKGIRADLNEVLVSHVPSEDPVSEER